MVRIGGITLNADVSYSAGENGGDIEIVIPYNVQLTDEQLTSIRDAETLEELDVNFGVENGVIGTYVLLGWRAIEKGYNGLRIRWQTYRTTDIEQLKQDNEDLTAALLELAALIGGGNND